MQSLSKIGSSLHSFDGYFNQSNQALEPSNKLHWTRSTWYTPPPETPPCLPADFYVGTSAASPSSSAMEDQVGNHHAAEADEFGWLFKDSVWRNVLTGDTSDDCPYGKLESDSPQP